MCVCNSAEYFYNFVDREFEEYGLSPDKDGKKLSSKDMVSIVEGYKGLGYAKNTEEELGISNRCWDLLAGASIACAEVNNNLWPIINSTLLGMTIDHWPVCK